MSVKQTVNIFLLVIIVFSLSGCLSLKKIDDKVLEQNQKYSDKFQVDYGDEVKQKQEEVKEKAKEATFNAAEKTIKFIATTLTSAVKGEIDKWLKDKKLNQYGDPEDTIYAGGSPLFNEATGTSTDKYEYILEKHPELVEELNLKN